MFNRIYRENKNEKIVIAWENQKNTFRNELFSEYKANRRNELKEKVSEAFPDIKEGLSYYGCIILEHEEAEGDDIVYALCNVLNERIKIISGDSDFIQLINENVRLFNPKKNEFSTKPDNDYVLFKSIQGDKSDNIDGIAGIGPKRAENILSNYNTFWDSLSEENKNKIIRNINLIDLSKNPHTNNIQEYVKKECEKEYEFSFDKIRDFVKKHKLVEIFSNLNGELGAFF